MNLLVTNAAITPAYSIIRALRPYANKIVVTISGNNRLAALGTHTAYSRHVDKACWVPKALRDWSAGRIQPDNTELEEAFIRRIEEICQQEAIDTIYPSHDALVYVLAKNKPRLEKLGVLVVGPDYDMLRTPLDKYESILAAHRAGIPTPRTYLPQTVEEVRNIAKDLGPPWVIKPRFTSSSRGTHFVVRREKLEAIWLETVQQHDKPLIQEFIPGNGRQNICVVAGRDGQILSLVCPQTTRITLRIYRNSTAAAIFASETPYRAQIEALVTDMGWWGSFTAQVKPDARDGKIKLLEINPRSGEVLWHRTESGINEPLMCVQLARGEAVEAVTNYPDGAILVNPISDLVRLPFDLLDLLIFKVRTVILGKRPIDPFNTPLSLAQRAASYRDTYSSRRRKILHPHTRYLLEDPLACLLWHWMTFAYMVVKIKTLGK